MNKQSKDEKVAQLELFEGLPVKKELEETGERVRMTFDRKTIERLNELTFADRKEEKKKGHKGNWYPKDTLKKMIDERYELRSWNK